MRGGAGWVSSSKNKGFTFTTGNEVDGRGLHDIDVTLIGHDAIRCRRTRSSDWAMLGFKIALFVELKHKISKC